MSDERDDLAPEDAAVARDLARLTPDPDPGWTAELGTHLVRDAHRRGLTTRPRALGLRVGVALLIGVLLLAAAFAQA